MVATDVPEEHVDQEWQRVKALRSHRHRLLNKRTYRKLERNKSVASAIGFENNAALLEDGLRNLMRRNDLDIHFGNHLDAQALNQITASLEGLCATLESIVNTSILEDQHARNDSKYPKLDCLLSTLALTKWDFVMVSGKGRKLFWTTEPEPRQIEVDAFNTSLNRLTQPDIGDFEVDSHKKTNTDDYSEPVDQIDKIVRPLQSLIGWIGKLAHCSGCHNVLWKLPEWDPDSSCRRKLSHLDLYISTYCHESSPWQECRLQELEDRENNDWQPANDLCNDIGDSYENQEKLDLGVLDADVRVYYGASEVKDTSNLASERQPSRTLKQLIKGGAFLDAWWTRGTRFNEAAKKGLAATLVLSFALTLDTDHVIRCWDPETLFFLVGADGEYIPGTPYALCTPTISRGDSMKLLQSASHKDDRESKSALLARLLMEIECGISLDHLGTDSDGQMQSGVETLEDFIYDQGMEDLSESRRSYLRAVRTCYRFNRQCQRIAATGIPGGEAAATRSVVDSIIKSIHKYIQHTPSPLESSHPIHAIHTSKKEQHYNWPVISSKSEQLGLANEIVTLQNPSKSNKFKRELQIRTKKVQWKDEVPVARYLEKADDEEEEEAGKKEIIVDSPIATVDETELFGSEDTHISSRELCISAKGWVTEFKKLRRNKIGVQGNECLKVAVLDTGTDLTHFDIKGRIVEHRCFVDGTTIEDKSGHGTHIAGIILDLTVNVDLYIAKVIQSRASQDRSPLVQALSYARGEWKVDIISLSLGFRQSSNPDMVQKEIEACLEAGIIVFASASNDAGNKPRTYPGDYDGVLCIHSATGEGNKSNFSPSPLDREDNFSFVGDCVRSCWPLSKESYDGEIGQKYLSGTSIATPIAISVAIFMIAYIKREMAEYNWNIKPWSPKGMRKIFRMMAHTRDGYDWVSPGWFFAKHTEEQIKANLKNELRAFIPKSAYR